MRRRRRIFVPAAAVVAVVAAVAFVIIVGQSADDGSEPLLSDSGAGTPTATASLEPDVTDAPDGDLDSGEGGAGGESLAWVLSEFEQIPVPSDARYPSEIIGRGPGMGQFGFTLRNVSPTEAVLYYGRELAARGWNVLDSNVVELDPTDAWKPSPVTFALFEKAETLLRVSSTPSKIASGWSGVSVVIDASPGNVWLSAERPPGP
jgi:hypothetical protein